MQRKFFKYIVVILLFQFTFYPCAFAEELVKKDPMLAALKSAVLPGWGQFENGEPEKGRIIQLSEFLDLGLYFVFDQRVKQSDFSALYTQDQQGYYLFTSNFFGSSVLTMYLANITDAYYSAENINRGNKFEKKDPMTALGLSAILPGAGQVYIGDNINDGVYSMLQGAYLLDRALYATNNTEKSWSLGVFGLIYVAGLCSYNGAIRHNENTDKLLQEEKKNITFYPQFEIGRVAFRMNCVF